MKMKVLIVKLSAFGDIIHALPALDAILARPEVQEVHWLVDARFAFVTEVLPKQVKVHQIALKGKTPLQAIQNTVKKLRKEQFDLVFDLQGLIKSAVLARLICPRVYGFDRTKIREKPASWLQTSVPFHPNDINIAQQCLRIAQAPWSKGTAIQAVDYIAPHISREFEAVLPQGLEQAMLQQKAVILNVGGSFATKELPDNTWKQVAKALLDKDMLPVWCWGNAAEQAKATRLASCGGFLLPQRLDMPQLCNMFRLAYATVAADTGILHLASALGTPTISFWGPTPRQRNAPHAKTDQYVESNPHCGPCIQKTCANFICMDMIQAAKIMQCIENVRFL
ncbi:MAG: glycosyltransferase family 9 protein [Mariprofundaceae bacterium]|nr:glycosyltransferase family 9 protein [Mariprofundaceae bacterium]